MTIAPSNGGLIRRVRYPAPMERLHRLLSWVWGPIGSAGIVVVVLIFLLLERESLRDRFIRRLPRFDYTVGSWG